MLCVVLGMYLPTGTFMGEFVYRFLSRIVGYAEQYIHLYILLMIILRLDLIIFLNSPLIFMPFVYTIIMVRIVD